MKNYFALIIFASLAFSCEKYEKESFIPQKEGNAVVGNCTLVATMGEQTKVTLGDPDEKAIPLYWSENDSIKVVLDNGSFAVMHMIDDGIVGHGAGCKTASFSVELPEGRSIGDAAFYPAKAVGKYYDHYYFNAPLSNQTSYGFQKNNHTMVGSISGADVVFHSITSYICLNITGPGHVYYITVSSDTGITNTWPEFDKDGKVFPDSQYWSKTEYFMCLDENNSLIPLSNDPENPTQIYIPVYMGTGGAYENGFTVTVYDPYQEVAVTKTVSHKVSVEPGTVINMPVFEIPFHFEFATEYNNGKVDCVGCNYFKFLGSSYVLNGDDAVFCMIDLDHEMTDQEIINTAKAQIDYVVKSGKTISEAVDAVAYPFGYLFNYGYNLTQNTNYPIAGFMIDHTGKVISNVSRKNVTTKSYVAPANATGTMYYDFLTSDVDPWNKVTNFSAPASIQIVQDPVNSSKYIIKDAYGIAGKDLTFTVDESGNATVDDCDTGLLIDGKSVHVEEAAEYTKNLEESKRFNIHSYYDIINDSFIFFLAYSNDGYCQWVSQDRFDF